MQQFVVPQFIDVENKIFGPITVRQFVILIIAALFIFIAYKLADFSLFIIEALLIIIVFGMFAFFKINGQPLHYFLLNFTATLVKPKIRIWDNKKTFSVNKKKNQPSTEKPIQVYRKKPMISNTRLEELALIIDTGGVYNGEDNL